MKSQKPDQDFALKDCTLAAIATGQSAQNLREFRNRMREVNLDSIYYHFWGGLLRPRFDDPQYHNDFAIWARYGLQDAVLAERLGIIDPNIFQDLESLRQELVELIEQRLDEVEWVPWAKAGNQFNFVRSQVVVFDTSARISTPQELSQALPGMSVGSIFFHFIDARRRSSNNMDDFRNWLMQNFSGHDELSRRLAQVDPFFSSLIELRDHLKEVFGMYFGG